MAIYSHLAFSRPVTIGIHMYALADANTAQEAERMEAESAFHILHARFVAEKRMNPLDNHDIYLEKWYQVCTDLCRSMNWDARNLSPEYDDTFINVWRRAEEVLNEEEYNFSTYAIYERITGVKPNTSSPEGHTQFNTFTTAYNAFCTTENFPESEGFPDTQDNFFKFYLANAPQSTEPAPAPPKQTPALARPAPTPAKSVHFMSVPPITTLPPPSSSLEDFPVLQAPSKAPISYASATSNFIPITHHRCSKLTTMPVSADPPTTTAQKIQGQPPTTGPKSLHPTKPPLPDALKTTKHTIILDHANPDTKALYTLDASELTRGLQRHLDTVKAPLVLLTGAWSTAPFYKNFILTFSGIVPFTDITKYNSVLFSPFGPNCRAAPTAGY